MGSNKYVVTITLHNGRGANTFTVGKHDTIAEAKAQVAAIRAAMPQLYAGAVNYKYQWVEGAN